MSSIPTRTDTYSTIASLLKQERPAPGHYALMLGTVVLGHFEKASYLEKKREEILAEIRKALGVPEEDVMEAI